MNKEKINKFSSSPESFIRAYIEKIILESPENRLFLIDDSPIFTRPLVGFAKGDDPLFNHYKDKSIIGPFHMTPRELLETCTSISDRDRANKTEDITVVCWVLPIAKRTAASNVSKNTWPSMRWAHTRYYGEILNNKLRQLLCSFLIRQGYLAIAPLLSPLWTRNYNYPGGPVSNWSERHALYAAGLGSFGLNGGLITEQGQAMRCGSIIVNLAIPPTPRTCSNHTDYCLFYQTGDCGICVDRCPAGAITNKGLNRAKCYTYMRESIGHINAKYSVEISGCGLCQTGVPCQSRIPVSKAK